jgi:hypothetical protein
LGEDVLKKVCLSLSLILIIPLGSSAQETIAAFDASILAGRSSAAVIRDGVGEDARFEAITAMWGNGGHLYVADNLAVRRIDLNSSSVTTLSRAAGSGVHRTMISSGYSYDYSGIYGLWSDGIALYGTDIGTGTLRKIDLDTGGVQTVVDGLGFGWGLSARGTQLFIAGSDAQRIFQVDLPTGTRSEFARTVAGSPRECFLGSGCLGYFVPAPRSSWSDGQNLYMSGYSGTVLKLDLDSAAQTFLPAAPFTIGPIVGAAGRLFVAATSGPQLGSVQLDSGAFTPISLPADGLSISALWSDGVGLYVAQGPYLKAQVIRRIDLASGVVTTYAGIAPIPQFANGTGMAARFQTPQGIWGDGATLYVADTDNTSIRRIDISTATVSQIAGAPSTPSLQDGIGTNARFIAPAGLWGDGATLYLTDAHSIRSVDLSTAAVTTLAGSGTNFGYRDGVGTDAVFYEPNGLWGKDGILYIADTRNRVIRQLNVASKEVTTMALSFGLPTALWGDGATLYVADNVTIRAVSLDTGAVRTVATAPGRLQGLWGTGNSLYTFVRLNPLGLSLHRIAIDTGELYPVVHGSADSEVGTPLIFPGASGIWGSDGSLFTTDDVDNTVRRLLPTPPPTSTHKQFANPGFSLGATTGRSSALSIASARITLDPGSVTPAAFALYTLRQNGVWISQTSVSAGHAIRSGRLSATAAPSVSSGIAIANPNVSAADITFYFTDPSGQNFGQGAFALAGGAQIARFLIEEPFNGPAQTDATFTFVSSLPVSAVAIRGYVNERSEFLMSTLPVADLSRQSSAPLIIPQLAVGGGWTTKLVLVNPTDQAISGTVQVLQANLAGSTYAIAPRASQRVSFVGTNTTTTGSLQIVPGAGPAPSAFCILSFVRDGVHVSETSILDVPPAPTFHMYVERTGSIRTGLAVTNPSALPVDLNLELANVQGAPLRTFSTPTLHVGPMGHASLFLDEISAITPMSGSYFLRISSSNGPAVSITGLLGRYNERGDFLIANTPAIPESTIPDTEPLYIPHVVSGGGYATQLVIFAAGSRSTGTEVGVRTDYFNQSGLPIGISIP